MNKEQAQEKLSELQEQVKELEAIINKPEVDENNFVEAMQRNREEAVICGETYYVYDGIIAQHIEMAWRHIADQAEKAVALIEGGK